MKKKTNNKKIIILVTVILMLCIIFSLLGVISSVSKKETNNNSSSSVNQLSDIINQLGSKYISECESNEKGYSKDIYLEFKCDLYENNESKEKIYINLMRAIMVNEKINLRLIDESKDIIIRIIYNSEQNSYYYTINGEENYFKKHDSINSLNFHTEVENTELRVNSKELENIISSNWNSSSVSIDSEMNKFNNYEDYFYNGIKVRNIMSKVYNVVFTEKYHEDVINGIEVGKSLEEVEKILGKPTFKNDNIIGYKNDDLYVFFSKNEISIYRNETYETKEFSKLLSQYLNNEINLKSFMNELTYLWDDYSEYTYSSNNLKIVYPLRGLKIDMSSYDDTLGIVLYENFSWNEDMEKFVKDKFITAEKSNLLLLTEENRIYEDSNQRYCATVNHDNVYGQKEEEEKSKLYMEYYVYNSNEDIKAVRFYSIDGSLPNIELKDDIYSLKWMSDTEIIYSVNKKGIYYYNLNTKHKQELVTGDEEFLIKNYESGTLNYDDKIIEIKEE